MYHHRNKGTGKTNMTAQQCEVVFHDEDNSGGGSSSIIDYNDDDDDVNTIHGRRDWVSKIAAGFKSLENSPPELYKVYAIKFLDSYSYFSVSNVFTLFLSDDFGYSDVEAGAIYGAFGAMITVYGFCIGFLVDNLGVSKSLKLGYGITILGRCGIFLTTSRKMLMFHIFGPLALGTSLGIPVLMTGIRRYTHETNRGFAFGIFYVVMNIAALFSGPTVDALTIWYKAGGVDDDADADNGEEATGAGGATTGWYLSSYRAIVLLAILANAVACCISFTIREIKLETPASVVANGASEKRNDETNGHGGEPPTSGVAVFRPKTGSPRKILGEIWKSPSFRRYLLVVVILLNVRQIFRHLDATWPKYMVREFGPNVPKGTIYDINPALIIILVPIVSATTAHIDPLVMIHIGTYISAASVFFLAMSTTIWSSCIFMVLLSIGEAIWSPRLNDYTVSVAEEGREGTYMALSSAPLFLAKLPVGILGGFLLEKFCPKNLEEGEERHSRIMWLIIGLLTATSPVLMTCCWGYISKKDTRSCEQGLQEGGKYLGLPAIQPAAEESSSLVKPFT
mmetsp:Transcript_34991/g.42228  ORF Transcript_34991/g.42228 Transcript_34991/m.42228 type:complete len:566 (-) Transcript_34991:123-1820(-)